MEFPTATSTLVGTTDSGKEVSITTQTQQYDVMFINTLFMENHKLRAKNEELERQLAATETSMKTVEETPKVSITTQTEEDDTKDIVSDASVVDDEVWPSDDDDASDVEDDVPETEAASNTTELDGPFYGTLEKRLEDGKFRNFLSWDDEEVSGVRDTCEVSADAFEGFSGTGTEPHVSSGIVFKVRYYLDDENNVRNITFEDGNLFNAYDTSYNNKFGRLDVTERGKRNEFYVWVGGQKVSTTPNNFFNKPNIRVSKHFDTRVDGTEVEVKLVQNHTGGTTQFASMVFRADGMPW